MWMVTYNDGVYRYNGTQLIHIPLIEDGKNVRLFSIYKDKKGGLWLGTHENGTYLFDGIGFKRFIP